MKKTTRLIIIILAAATLLVIYSPEEEVTAPANNNIIRTTPPADIDADDELIDEDFDEDLEDDLAEIEEALEALLGWDEDESDETMDNENGDESDDTMNGDETNDEIDVEWEEVTLSLNWYAEFGTEELQQALSDWMQVALFFHADWCPTCAALHNSLNTNTTAFDDDMVVFKLDYDSETELKEQFTITSQHTVVFVDADMNETNRLWDAITYQDVLNWFWG